MSVQVGGERPYTVFYTNTIDTGDILAATSEAMSPRGATFITQLDASHLVDTKD
jgi:hypothetical protein